MNLQKSRRLCVAGEKYMNIQNYGKIMFAVENKTNLRKSRSGHEDCGENTNLQKSRNKVHCVEQNKIFFVTALKTLYIGSKQRYLVLKKIINSTIHRGENKPNIQKRRSDHQDCEEKINILNSRKDFTRREKNMNLQNFQETSSDCEKIATF